MIGLLRSVVFVIIKSTIFEKAIRHDGYFDSKYNKRL